MECRTDTTIGSTRRSFGGFLVSESSSATSLASYRAKKVFAVFLVELGKEMADDDSETRNPPKLPLVDPMAVSNSLKDNIYDTATKGPGVLS